MSDAIRFNVYVTVKEGRLEEFRKLAKSWIKGNQKNDHILSYEWFASGDDETCYQIMEIYDSSEALLATMGEVAKAGETDYPYVMDKLEVCGKITDALRERLDKGKSSQNVYFDHFDGFTR